MIKFYITIIIIILLTIIYLFVSNRKLYSSNKVISGNEVISDKKIVNPKNLMIVAHPDDELIFGGKELLSKDSWKIVSITNGSAASQNKFSFNRSDRKKEFINVMNTHKWSYEIWDYEDNLFNANWDIYSLTNELNRVINEQKYEMIVTHNLYGEYGHIQHRKISELIYSLKPNNLYVFSYDENSHNPYAQNIKTLLATNYGSQKKVIEKHNNCIEHQTTCKITF